MRPVRLDMDGFASFREPTSVDFSDVDYFALIGPTGAGKSTVIDAMTFALFGTVPRWENKKAISNALAPTAERGTVRLIFDLDGERYVAARELRRTRQGVQQKSVRLELFDDPDATGSLDDPTEVLAADSQVTPAVEKLLGLTFEHFTQSVVLPQGEFAQFLRASGATRRSMLLKLLGADIYFDIGKAANIRAKTASDQAQLLADQLTRFGDATADAEAAAQQRVDELTALAGTVTDALPRLDDADKRLIAARSAVEQLTADYDRLASLRAPSGLPELHAQLQAATNALADARTTEELAQDADTAARQALEGAPARGPLEQARRDHDERDRLRAQIPTARTGVEDAAARRSGATTSVQRADDALEHARQHRERVAEAARAAATNVMRLTEEIDALRRVTVPAGLPALDERLQTATDALTDAETDVQTAERAEDTARAALDNAPARAPLERALATVRDLAEARAAVEPLRAARDRADAALTAAETARAEAAERLGAARAHRDAAAVAQGAAALRTHLAVGDPCPVCEQTVSVLPAPADGTELDAAERGVADADATHARAQQATDAAARGASDAHARLDAATERVDALASARDGQPQDETVIAGELARLDALSDAVRTAGARLRDARSARQEARDRLSAAEAEAAALREAFTAARDTLVPLGAPAGGQGSLLQAWTGLATWAVAEAGTRTAALTTARTGEEEAAAALAGAEEAFVAAEAAQKTARDQETDAATAHSSAVTALRGLEERLAELDQSLTAAPSTDDIAAALRELDHLEVTAHAADESLRAARAARRAAVADLDALTERGTAAWRQLRAARDQLVPLGAPDLPTGSVLDGWTELLGWAATEAASRGAALPEAQTVVTVAAEHRDRQALELTQTLTAHGIPIEAGPLARTAPAAVAAATATALAEVRRIAERRAQAADLADQRDAAVSQQQVAKMLGNLLRSDKFPEWLESAALDTLVMAASESLAELSGGQFELTHRDGEFFVVDHADADSLRSVRTLSGGETFQASLALALALSSQLSALAAEGAARLDSIFLDEGFGTLDESTLEVVAGTLENLASGDRMVGVITHVAALAERVPVRYAVRRDARTSTITRETA